MRRLASLAFVLAVGLAPAEAFAADFDIGVAAPLNGPDAVFGNQIRLGVEQAVADINAAGGFRGLKGRVVARDDGGDAKKAADVAGRFVAEKTAVVIGDFSSAATLAGSAVYAEAGVLDITPSALAPSVTGRGLATVFRTGGRDDQQAEVAARFLLSRHVARIAIVHDRTSTGRQLADGVRKLLGQAGMRDVFYGSIENGTHDLSGLVGRIKASGAQVVFFNGSATEGGLLAKQLHDANAHAVLLGGATLASDEFAIAADGGADGSMIIFPQDPRTRPAATDLLRRLRGRGVEPEAYVFYAYAAVQVVQQAASAAKSLSSTDLAAVMHGGTVFRTVLGDMTFDRNGDPAVSDYAVYVWHKGATGRMTFDDLAKT